MQWDPIMQRPGHHTFEHTCMQPISDQQHAAVGGYEARWHARLIYCVHVLAFFPTVCPVYVMPAVHLPPGAVLQDCQGVHDVLQVCTALELTYAGVYTASNQGCHLCYAILCAVLHDAVPCRAVLCYSSGQNCSDACRRTSSSASCMQ